MWDPFHFHHQGEGRGRWRHPETEGREREELQQRQEREGAERVQTIQYDLWGVWFEPGRGWTTGDYSYYTTRSLAQARGTWVYR